MSDPDDKEAFRRARVKERQKARVQRLIDDINARNPVSVPGASRKPVTSTPPMTYQPTGMPIHYAATADSSTQAEAKVSKSRAKEKGRIEDRNQLDQLFAQDSPTETRASSEPIASPTLTLGMYDETSKSWKSGSVSMSPLEKVIEEAESLRRGDKDDLRIAEQNLAGFGEDDSRVSSEGCFAGREVVEDDVGFMIVAARGERDTDVDDGGNLSGI